MTNPVIAIGIDAAERTVIEKWLNEGHLPNMRRLRDQGAYARVKNFPYYRAESPWNVFLTGVSPQKSGFWTELNYNPETYRTKFGIYDFKEFPPFYAVPKGKRVAIFDMPKTELREEVDGFQMLGWGAHAAATPSHSLPTEAFDDIVARHGNHPTYEDDHAILWSQKSFDSLLERSLIGLERRVAICKELLEREEWDFFMTLLGESHSFGHSLWHMFTPDHPYYKPGVEDLILEMFQKLDQAIGQILESAPDNAQVYIFSVHGMEPNNLDVTSCLFLPEMMYRFNFPDRQGLVRGDINKPVPPIIPNWQLIRRWVGECWSRIYDPNPARRFLRRALPMAVYNKVARPIFGAEKNLPYPYDLGEFFWMPPVWWRPYWPEMKAFALPSFSEGYIRINLKGRDPQGIVEPEEYHALCDEIEALVRGVINPRSGNPIVRDVMRTRTDPLDNNPKLPKADMVFLWTNEVADVVDSEQIGRIGPVPLERSGGHTDRGFMIATAPDIPAGIHLPEAHCLDLTATLVDAMGAPVPEYMEGESFLHQLRGHKSEPTASMD